MKSAFTLYGLLALIVLVGAYYAFQLSNNQNESMESLTLTSSAFESGSSIPSKYTCDGENINPPLSISNIPKDAKSLVLIMDDPDVPKQLRPDGVFDHWTVYSLPPDTTEISERAALSSQGLNGRGGAKYTGPCPPTEYEPTEHRYFFKLYALSETLTFDSAPSKKAVEEAMRGKILEQTELMGVYDRAK